MNLMDMMMISKRRSQGLKWNRPVILYIQLLVNH